MPRLKPDQTPLTGIPFKEFRDALISAYPISFNFQEMLTLYLERDLARITNPLNNMDMIAFQVIQAADAQGWSRELLLGARAGVPGNPDLLAVAQKYGLSAAVYEQSGGVATTNQPAAQARLEKIVRQANPMIDGEKFRAQMVALEARVCRIEYPERTARGTGFLVGTSAVMTNYHVIKPLLMQLEAGLSNPNAVVLRFGYKRTSDGIEVSPGTTYRLKTDDPNENWLIDSSPPNAAEEAGQEGQPTPDELDYALLYVDGKPGDDPAGKAEGLKESPARGFIEQPIDPPTFNPDDPLYILQHPKGDPLQWAFDTSAIIGERDNGLRVRYRTNTLDGSSGSPCFNANFELVALHHMGDPGASPAAFNQGVPFPVIMKHLPEAKRETRVGV